MNVQRIDGKFYSKYTEAEIRRVLFTLGYNVEKCGHIPLTAEEIEEKADEMFLCGCGSQTPMNNQTIKADAGKPRLSLVPPEIIRCIARVREYAVNGKYHDPDNWKRVEPERYRDAMYRHLLAYIEDPNGVDEESRLPHLWHLATNVAFLCEMEKGR